MWTRLKPAIAISSSKLLLRCLSGYPSFLKPRLKEFLCQKDTNILGSSFLRSMETKTEQVSQRTSTEVPTDTNGTGQSDQTAVSPSDYTIVKEGKAEILFPNKNKVFYNPVQEFNRDLTVAVISLFAEEQLKKKGVSVGGIGLEQSDKERLATDDLPTGSQDNTDMVQAGEKCQDGITILEALSATGLRAVRFAKEVPGIKEIVANDLSREAVSSIQKNITHNGVDDMVVANHADASAYMYEHRGKQIKFDVIDLDPYGSPSAFLDSAVQSVKDGGLLCITCTDAAVMCGNGSETCWTKYGSMSLRAKYCHEMALRIVLSCLDRHANRYHRYIVPQLSLFADFYCRVFVRVYISQAQAKRSASKQAMVYHCSGCETFNVQRIGRIVEKNRSVKFHPGNGPPVGPKCEHCSATHQIGGPVWAEPLHDAGLVQRLLSSVENSSDRFNTAQRMVGMLSVVSEELPDCPMFYCLDKLASVVRVNCPPLLAVRSAILHAGYQVSLSHTCKTAVKTDAPAHVIWDIMRGWAKQNPANSSRLSSDAVASTILGKEPGIEANFTIRADANPASRQKGLKRFQENPPNWGPKARAGRGEEAQEDRRRRLQGKRQQELLDLKQFPCKRFKQGHCVYGDDCRYSHELVEQENSTSCTVEQDKESV
ncbi:tRNA (guanine(26)-N(2))-dimethyltransferase-like [Branchiostoma floridae]|uniref:tRNA (guanine(26)-N(2))-dimethyltransferase n=1 Tax=Branchiostoma floridae TaxID=7739 RepID=A0A9J7M5S5_BRAFL|nr:tRNA (guanine(26)-N(2))-dimethyltransferase-like [Branchiostoma floridae]